MIYWIKSACLFHSVYKFHGKQVYECIIFNLPLHRPESPYSHITIKFDRSIVQSQIDHIISNLFIVIIAPSFSIQYETTTLIIDNFAWEFINNIAFDVSASQLIAQTASLIKYASRFKLCTRIIFLCGRFAT